MSNIPFPGRRGICLLLFLSAITALAACEDQQTPKPTQRPTATPTAATTTETGTPRIAYPWAMKQRQLMFSNGTVWLPVDVRVYQEMEADFLTYWTWSGLAGPAAFPFLPDEHQIALLAVPDFRPSLQQYIDQIRASNQVLAYVAPNPARPSPPLQQVASCMQDGLQCQSLYSFDAATKTLYNSQTGQVLSQKTHTNVVFDVTQIYDKEMHLWKLSSLLFQELPA